jgi:hypothetical protein
MFPNPLTAIAILSLDKHYFLFLVNFLYAYFLQPLTSSSHDSGLHYNRNPHFHIMRWVSIVHPSPVSLKHIFCEVNLIVLASCLTPTWSTKLYEYLSCSLNPSSSKFRACAISLRQWCREFVTHSNPSLYELNSVL